MGVDDDSLVLFNVDKTRSADEFHLFVWVNNVKRKENLLTKPIMY